MRICAAGAGRWRAICASRQTMHEHSGTVIPVRGQIAMVGLSIAKIEVRVDAP